MTRVRLALACAAALLLALAARAEPPPPAAGGARPAPPRTTEAARPDAASWSAPPRPRVTAGVLVRAAKRAQQRDTTCGPCTARPGDEPRREAPRGAIESLEIDWNADRPSP